MASLKTLILILAIFQLDNAQGQHRSIEGRLLNAEDFHGLGGVIVETVDTKYRSITDSTGRFALVLPVEYEKVVIKFIGFEQDTVLIEESKPVYRLLWFHANSSHGRPIKLGLKRHLRRQKEAREELLKQALSSGVFVN